MSLQLILWICVYGETLTQTFSHGALACEHKQQQLQIASDHYLVGPLGPGTSLGTDSKLWIGTSIIFISPLLWLAYLKLTQKSVIDWDSDMLKDKNFLDFLGFTTLFSYLGLNLMILSIHQHSTPQVLLCSAFTFAALATLSKSCKSEQLEAMTSNTPQDHVICANTVYMDFRQPFMRLFVTFAGQIIIMFVFCLGVGEKVRSGDRMPINYFYWLFSIPAFQVFIFYPGYKSLGHKWFPWAYARHWRTLLRLQSVFLKVEDEEHILILHVRQLELWTRLFMSFTINGVLVFFFFIVMPLVLGHSPDSMEFTFNVFAVSFICDLDATEAIRFEICEDSMQLELESSESDEYVFVEEEE